MQYTSEICIMADTITYNGDYSQDMTKINGYMSDFECGKCKEYEIYIEGILEELESARMINKLLQKEVLSSATKNAHGKDPVSTKGSSNKISTKEWTTVTAKNYLTKLSKSDKCKYTTSEQHITTPNPFTPLSNLKGNGDPSEPQEQNQETSTQNKNQQKTGTKIPTIINGAITNSEDRNPIVKKKKRHTY